MKSTSKTTKRSSVLNVDQQMHVSKALADACRHQIMEAIYEFGSMTSGDLCERFLVTPATISHHVRVLREASLIRTEREGQFRRHEPQREVLNAYVAELFRM